MKAVAFTDLGVALSGKERLQNTRALEAVIEEHVRKVRTQLRAGLQKEQYDEAQKQLTALLSAQLIVKSISIAQSQQ